MSRPNLFNSLVKEAAIQSKQSGERGLSARSVKKATRVRFVRHCLFAAVNTYDLGHLDQV